MKKWCMIIDIEKCENCNNCFLSCKDEHCGNNWPGYSISQPLHGQRWINIHCKERGKFPVIDAAYLPMPCMHCEDPMCIKIAKNNAVYKRDDGIVIIDPVKAKGQNQIVSSCPYSAIWWNKETQTPQKCTFCAHLLDQGWKAPRCVQSCPTGALSIQKPDENEVRTFVEKNELEVLGRKNRSTLPLVYYKNLYRFTKCFIAGSVAVKKQEIEDCAADAQVKLLQNNKIVNQAKSDAFGDFKFDNLEKNSGNYRIIINYNDFEQKEIEVELKEQSLNIGVIWL